MTMPQYFTHHMDISPAKRHPLVTISEISTSNTHEHEFENQEETKRDKEAEAIPSNAVNLSASAAASNHGHGNPAQQQLTKIAFLRTNIDMKTRELHELHRVKDAELKQLKRVKSRLFEKVALLDSIAVSGKSVQDVLAERREIHNSYVKTMAKRQYNEQKLQKVKGENLNLKEILQHLSMIANSFDNNDGEQQLSCNIEQVSATNRRLERQIKFLKHLIETEKMAQKKATNITAGCSFNVNAN